MSEPLLITLHPLGMEVAEHEESGTLSNVFDYELVPIGAQSASGGAFDPCPSDYVIPYVVFRVSVQFRDAIVGDPGVVQTSQRKAAYSDGINTRYADISDAFPTSAPGFVSTGHVAVAPDGGPWTPAKLTALTFGGAGCHLFNDSTPFGPYVGGLLVDDVEIDVYGWLVGHVPDIWTRASELQALPITGGAASAWNAVLAAANDTAWTGINLTATSNGELTKVMAGAMVYARDPVTYAALRLKVYNAIKAAKATLDTPVAGKGRALEAGRQVGTLCICANLIDLPNYDPEGNSFRDIFRLWLIEIRDTNLGGNSTWPSIRKTAEWACNNWGAFCRYSQIAISVYLGDATAIARAADIFKAWCGEDRAAYPDDAPYNGDANQLAEDYFYLNGPPFFCHSTFKRGAGGFLGVNPAGTSKTIQGSSRDLSGALGEDLGRIDSTGDWPVFTAQTSGSVAPGGTNVVVQLTSGAPMASIAAGQEVYDANGNTQYLPAAGVYVVSKDDALKRVTLAVGPAVTMPSGATLTFGGNHWPPEAHGCSYSWEVLQGMYAVAEILNRQGYPAYTWGNNALKRMIDFMLNIPSGSYPAGTATYKGMDSVSYWVPYLAKKRYATDYVGSFNTPPVDALGRNVAWTAWTHQ